LAQDGANVAAMALAKRVDDTTKSAPDFVHIGIGKVRPGSKRLRGCAQIIEQDGLHTNGPRCSSFSDHDL
jgi:hypothetical protein